MRRRRVHGRVRARRTRVRQWVWVRLQVRVTWSHALGLVCRSALTWISFSRAVACEAKRRMPSHRALLIKQCGAVRLEPRTLAEITA